MKRVTTAIGTFSLVLVLCTAQAAAFDHLHIDETASSACEYCSQVDTSVLPEAAAAPIPVYQLDRKTPQLGHTFANAVQLCALARAPPRQ